MSDIHLPGSGDRTTFWSVKLKSAERPAGAALRFDEPTVDHYRKRLAVRAWYPVPGPETERLALVVWLSLPAVGPAAGELQIDYAGDVTLPELIHAYEELLAWARTAAARAALLGRSI